MMKLEEYRESKYYQRVLEVISTWAYTAERVEKLCFRGTDIIYDFASKAELGTLTESEDKKNLHIFLGNLNGIAVYLVI